MLRKPSACLRSAPGGRAERDRGARRGSWRCRRSACSLDLRVAAI